MPTITATLIDDYAIEVEDIEGRVNAYISKRTPTREYTASLAALQDTGELESSDGHGHKVHQQTITALEEWAIKNGY